MELIKDVYFNTDKLIENTKVKISYTGMFYERDNDKVYLHYGYGENWNDVNELEMTKTDLGYQVELDLPSTDTLNFCFKNQDNEWDNNFGENYIFNIEKNLNNNIQPNKKNSFTIFGKNFNRKIAPNTNISDLSNISSKTEENTSTTTHSKTSNLENDKNNKSLINETAIAVVPAGFNYWTKKIKETVFKFFAYIPKLLSGNYKRNVINEKNKN